MPNTAATTQIHGMFGAVFISATQIAITEWSVEHTADLKDGTTTVSAGWKQRVPGVQEMTGSFKCIWDTSQNPYLINIVPNTLVTLKLYVTSSANIAGGGNSFYQLSAYIKSVSVSEPVGDLVTYTVAFESHGTVTTPT